jgi:hypothetical protein
LLPLPKKWGGGKAACPAAACPAAGTPSTNTTFFCEALSGNCFLLRSAAASQLGFYDAADTCAGFVGGNLVVYNGRSKQMLVGSSPSTVALLPALHAVQAEAGWRARCLCAAALAQLHGAGACCCRR